MTCYLSSSAEEVVCEIATEDNNKVIYQQNAPIRKCAASEVPIDEPRKDIHSFYLSIWAKIAFSTQSHKEKHSKKVVGVYFCNVLITKEEVLEAEKRSEHCFPRGRDNPSIWQEMCVESVEIINRKADCLIVTLQHIYDDSCSASRSELWLDVE